MKIKVFKNEDEANEFIATVDLHEKGGVQYYDGQIVVFYNCPKSEYNTHFVDHMIEGLTNNLFHEQVRKMAVDAEIEVFKEKGTNLEGYDDAKKRQKEADKNISLLQAKLDTLNEWKAKNS